MIMFTWYGVRSNDHVYMILKQCLHTYTHYNDHTDHIYRLSTDHPCYSSMQEWICSMFNVQCSMFNAQCSMFNIQCSLFNVQCSLFNVQCSMFNAQCSMFIVQCSMFIVQCSMFNVHKCWTTYQFVHICVVAIALVFTISLGRLHTEPTIMGCSRFEDALDAGYAGLLRLSLPSTSYIGIVFTTSIIVSLILHYP